MGEAVLLGPMLTLGGRGTSERKIPFSPHTNLGSVCQKPGGEEGHVNMQKELLLLPLMACPGRSLLLSVVS